MKKCLDLSEKKCALFGDICQCAKEIIKDLLTNLPNARSAKIGIIAVKFQVSHLRKMSLVIVIENNGKASDFPLR